MPRIKGAYASVSRLRALSARLTGSVQFPDLLFLVNGLFVVPEGGVLDPAEVSRHLFENNDVVIFKEDDSSKGRGTRVFTRDSFVPADCERMSNGVFQRFLEQHPFFRTFGSEAIATLRLTTVVDDTGRSSVRAAYLRLGRRGDRHVTSGTHIRVPVDLPTGTLLPQGYRPDWSVVDRHPDTATSFGGQAIPSFATCVEEVRRLQSRVPFVRCLGWDTCIDSNGETQIMEWNTGQNDIRFSEATQGPCFADLGWEKLWRD